MVGGQVQSRRSSDRASRAPSRASTKDERSEICCHDCSDDALLAPLSPTRKPALAANTQLDAAAQSSHTPSVGALKTLPAPKRRKDMKAD